MCWTINSTTFVYLIKQFINILITFCNILNGIRPPEYSDSSQTGFISSSSNNVLYRLFHLSKYSIRRHSVASRVQNFTFHHLHTLPSLSWLSKYRMLLRSALTVWHHVVAKTTANFRIPYTKTSKNNNCGASKPFKVFLPNYAIERKTTNVFQWGIRVILLRTIYAQKFSGCLWLFQEKRNVEDNYLLLYL